MAQAMAFPRELERNFFRDMDREFFTIFIVLFILCNSITLYFAGQPPKEFSAEEVKKYTEALYRVKVTTAPKIERKAKQESSASEAAKVEEEKVEEAPKGEVRQQTAEEKAAKVEAERAARQERQEKRRAAIAEKVKIIAGPTARGVGRRRGGAAAAREAIGLSGGAMEGLDVKGMVGMVGDAGTAEKVKKLRGGGAVAGDVGDIDIAELKALSASDLNLMLSEAPVQVSRSAITAKGSGTKAKQRSQNAISDIVLQNKNQVQYCYWTLKRRDSSLKGRVVVEFTIAPSGEVVRVRFRESNWGGNALGAEAEKCIDNVISSWHFEPIGEGEGNVTAGATYIFE